MCLAILGALLDDKIDAGFIDICDVIVCIQLSTICQPQYGNWDIGWGLDTVKRAAFIKQTIGLQLGWGHEGPFR